MICIDCREGASEEICEYCGYDLTEEWRRHRANLVARRHRSEAKFSGAVKTVMNALIMGVDPEEATLDWIGMKVKARFLRNAKLKPTDVYFAPLQ